SLPPGSVDPSSMVLPVNGTREALFAFTQAVIDATRAPIVAMPNPFYQIYDGASLLAGAERYFLELDEQNRFLPDLDRVPENVWRRCQLLFLCSPNNPTGAVASLEYLRHAIELADRYDFVIAADECYSEIYLDEAHPPPGLLQAAIGAGHAAFERCVVFHSLSKRSSVPGLRSGFVAGDPKLLKPFLLYRTYHGCAMSARVLPILREAMPVDAPDASFYLWPRVRDDERFARELFERKHVTILPGRYLARETAFGNPGVGRVRISLVASVPECEQAAE